MRLNCQTKCISKNAYPTTERPFGWSLSCLKVLSRCLFLLYFSVETATFILEPCLGHTNLQQKNLIHNITVLPQTSVNPFWPGLLETSEDVRNRSLGYLGGSRSKVCAMYLGEWEVQFPLGSFSRCRFFLSVSCLSAVFSNKGKKAQKIIIKKRKIFNFSKLSSGFDLAHPTASLFPLFLSHFCLVQCEPFDDNDFMMVTDLKSVRSH